MQQMSRLSLSSIDSFPLGDRNFLRAVAPSESHKSILKHLCLMIEEILVFCTFGPNIKSHFGLMKCPICHGFISESGVPAALFVGATSGDCTLDLDG
jgi:hypothetical protein